jgi:hypothetical protein
MATTDEIFRFHVANLRVVKRAVSGIERPIKLAIREGDQAREEVLTKLYMLLVAAKLECRLLKLLYEPYGFNDAQRAKILRKDSQLDRWLAAVDVGFKFQYKVRRVTSATVGFAAATQRTELRRLIQKELRPLIELRNKLAHGQWAYTLNNSGTDVANAQMKMMKTLNFTNIRLRAALADYLCDAIHELVVAHDVSKRNFDQHYNRVLEIQRNLDVQDHNKWSAKLQARHIQAKKTQRTARQAGAVRQAQRKWMASLKKLRARISRASS